MVDSVDVQSRLSTGNWASSPVRAKTPKPSYDPPIRANQSSKLDRNVPRSFDLLPRAGFPPPPSVEDEAESLAREHGGASVVATATASTDEEPKYRGEVEQYPILLPVHEHNPERRFVYVGSKSPDGGCDSDSDKNEGSDGTIPPKDGYTANTCRKFTMPLRPVDKSSDKPADPKPKDNRVEKGVGEPCVRDPDKISAKSRKRTDELPRLETNIESANPYRNPSTAPSPTTQRTKSSPYIDQKPRGYFDRQEPIKPPGDGYLSPVPSVIKHATNGRERMYLDFNPSKQGSEVRKRTTIINGGSRVGHDSRDERRSAMGYERHPHPPEPPAHKRSSSTADIPKSPRTTSERRPDRHYCEESASTRTNRRTNSPPPSERRVSPPSRRYSHREKLSRGTYKSRRNSPSPPRDYDDYGYSSDEHPKSRAPTRDVRDHRKSFISQDERNYMLSPDVGRPPLDRRPRSRHGTTPLPSPRSSQAGFSEPSQPLSPRHSNTAPPIRERRLGDERYERSVSPFSAGRASSPPYPQTLTLADDEPARHLESASRTPSLNPSVSAPVAIAGAAAATTLGMTVFDYPAASGVERSRSPVPASLPATVPPRSPREDSFGSNTSQKGYWQPPHFNPVPAQNGYIDQPVVSYRRYSEDVSQGRVPDLPTCPRQEPRAGYADWLTFPRCNNFNICPDCYSGVFAKTEFLHQFVPAPFRPMDKPLACNFGTSPWYRIAWLMTRKAQLPDLQLLQKMAAVESKHQPCSGDQRMTRIWQTIRHPSDNRPVENFNVCLHCANAVQSLFPNLAGIFQPSDPKAEPAKRVCSLHFAPERKRFLLYFDVLEDTSDRALSKGSIPDVERLCERLRRISVTSCTRDQLLSDRRWYMMRSLEDLTVCEECFEQVVQPEMQRANANGNALACDFYAQPQKVRGPASCQLYSPRMRELFARACRKNDLHLLGDEVRERVNQQLDLADAIAHFRSQNLNGMYTDKIEACERAWQRWE